jgi:hypothetical protein
VNLKRVAKRVRRETTAHPAKAAVLGLLFLVALWFWAPLILGWMEEDGPAKVSAAEEPTGALSPAVAAAGSAEPTGATQPKQTWRQLVQWMQGDPRTGSADSMSGRRDPFLAVQHEEEEFVELIDDPEENTRRGLSPQDLGLEFSSTIIGLDRRVAQINGRSYREGETIRLARDGEEIEFTLAAVYPRQVLLERNGEQYELLIRSPMESGGIELSRNED